MKNLIIAALFVCSLFMQPVMAQEVIFDKVAVTVEGLGCPFCAFGLEKKMKALQGIQQIKIDIETGMMTFEVPTTAHLTQLQVDEKVEEAGYTAKKIEIYRAEPVAVPVAADVVLQEVITDAVVASHSFKVGGACGMCSSRILRTAVQINGVSNATYDLEKQLLTLTLDATKTTLLQVKQAIAAKGHDTDTVKAETAVYDKLPPCCKYRD